MNASTTLSNSQRHQARDVCRASETCFYVLVRATYFVLLSLHFFVRVRVCLRERERERDTYVYEIFNQLVCCHYSL